MRAQLIELTPERRSAVAEGVVIEHRLHQRLAVVEGAFDRQRVHVVVLRRGHHPPLHLGDAAVREEHHEVDLGTAAEGFDRGAAGVARCGDDDGGALGALAQHVVHQPRQQLHRQILEGERRPVEQLEHEQAGRELDERRGRRMAEGAVGLLRHAREVGLGDRVADEGADHLDRDLGVGAAGKAGDGLAHRAWATSRARKGRRRGQAPRASPRQNRARGPRPALRRNALIQLCFMVKAQRFRAQ